jgi:hypothetical protein
MLWLTLFSLFGVVSALLCAAALVLCFAATVIEGVLTCAEKVLTNLNDGRVIIALLYLIPALLLFCALCDGIRLALSFCFAVFK